MQTKAYIAIESFIWKGGDIVHVGDELQLSEYEAKPLVVQTRVVLKQTPVAVVDVPPPAPAPQDKSEPRDRGRGKRTE